MAKRKVIEDSDNEDHGSPSPEKVLLGPEPTSIPAINNDDSAAHQDVSQSAEQSTASTGMSIPPCIVKRRILNSHRNYE